MKWRVGLSAKFGALIAIALLVLLAVVLLMLQRQRAMQAEVIAVGGESMRALTVSRLRKRGEAAVVQVAEALVNPLYYFDLDAIGGIAREAMRQPDVAYVLVFDTNGDIIHDGSGDIPTYGQAMDDPLAYEVVSARGPHEQWADGTLDVSAPISVGGQRLGGVRIGFSMQSARADERQAVTRMSRRLDQIGQSHQTWITLLLLSLVVLGVAVSYAVQRALVRPIRQLAAAAREIEAGNFSADVPESRRRDEVGDLLRAFRRMCEGIGRHDRDIRRMAYTDPLTGLANRLAFRENLDRRVLELQGAGRQMALLFADIDDFKRVNDSLGHDAGDEVLVQFATRIGDAVVRYGGSEVMLARFGGDEFVILLLGDGRSDGDMRELASGVAENLVSELSRPIRVQDRQVFLGTSIGITLFPEDARDAPMLMKNGDIAMYQAKVAGKNCYRFFSRAMDRAVARRIRMESDLRGAWERGELTLSYQPVPGRGRGAAALAARGAGGDRAVGLHRRGRAERTDRADRPGSAAGGLPRRRRLGAGERGRPVRFGQCLGAPAARRRSAAACRTRVAGVRAAAAGAAPGADRNHDHRRREAGQHDAERAARRRRAGMAGRFRHRLLRPEPSAPGAG
jgi:diguanylate cyclase (GGDEF)-like protein